MRITAIVLVTIVLSFLLTPADAFKPGSLNLVNAQYDILTASDVLVKRGGSAGVVVRSIVSLPRAKRRERPYRVPSLPPITDQAAIRAGAITATIVAVHAAAIGAGLVSPPQSAAGAVGYLGLHSMAAAIVYPAVFHGTKSAVAKAKTCLGPYCHRLYQNLRHKIHQEAKSSSEEALFSTPQLKQLAKKGGHRNAKLLASSKSTSLREAGLRPDKRTTSIPLQRRSLPSSLVQTRPVKRSRRKNLTMRQLLHYGRSRRRQRPYKVRVFHPIAKIDKLKSATMLTATSLATHGTAIKLGLLPPVPSIPIGVAVLGIHGVAAGLVAPIAYRASMGMLVKAKKCLGPLCQYAYDRFSGSSKSAKPKEYLQPSSQSAFSDVDHVAKKGGRRIAKVVAAKRTTMLSKRSFAGDCDDGATDTILIRSSKHIGGLKVIKAAKGPKKIKTLPRNGPPTIGTAQLLRTAQWGSTAAMGHVALIASGALSPPSTVPELAGILAFHTIAAGIAAPLVYKAAKGPMKRVADRVKSCVGPMCQMAYQKLVRTAQPTKVEEREEAIKSPSLKAKPASMQESRRYTKNMTGKPSSRHAKRSLKSLDSDSKLRQQDINFDNRVIGRMPLNSLKRRAVGGAGKKGLIVEVVRKTRRKRPMPSSKPPAIGIKEVLRAMKWASTSTFIHGAIVANSALAPPTSVPALIGTLALHTAATGIAAPLVYDAAMPKMRKMAEKIKTCVGPHCQRLYEGLAKNIPPASVVASTTTKSDALLSAKSDRARGRQRRVKL